MLAVGSELERDWVHLWVEFRVPLQFFSSIEKQNIVIFFLTGAPAGRSSQQAVKM